MKRATGFTLVELAVTFAVMAVLMAAGLPFARAWTEGNRQLQARNLVWEAVSQTRAMALRNPAQAPTGDESACLQRSGDLLRVFASCSGAALWSGTLPEGTATRLPGVDKAAPCDLSAVAFDNRGRVIDRVATDPACVPDDTQTRVAVGFGNQEPLYVDLL